MSNTTENKRPFVSVCMISYNHEQFIRKAIDSVLMQRTSFHFELVIGEDCSKDNTATIVKEYEKNYPGIIKTRCNNKNIGMSANFVQTLKECSGKYIAILEGDDYWTDDNKLQIQVDFLEKNESIYGCFHDAINVDEENNIIKNNYYNSPQKLYNQKEALTILQSKYATCSLLFRGKSIQALPTWFLQKPCDFTLDLLITQYGQLAYFPLNMSAYRIHKGGIWQGNNSVANHKENLARLRVLLKDPILKKIYKKNLHSMINSIKNSLAIEYANQNSLKRFKYGIEWMMKAPFSFRNVRTLIGPIFFPKIYKLMKRIFINLKSKIS